MTAFNQIEFYTSVNKIQNLPAEFGSEVAFAGRSNAGKSSVINTLTNRDKLAFVSKTPGRTRLINFFQLTSDRFLVDLPGYGYAKVPLATRKHWEALLSTYLQTRRSLCGLVLIMDARHPLTTLDLRMLDWFVPTGKSVHILLTKSDKINRQIAKNTLANTNKFLKGSYPNCTSQLFSSFTATGVEESIKIIGEWFSVTMSK